MSNTVYIVDDKGDVESFTDVIALMKYLDSEFTLGCLPDDHTWTTSSDELCCICGGSMAKKAHDPSWTLGNNAGGTDPSTWRFEHGKCCDDCNKHVVLPERLMKYTSKGEQK
tara:strand:+ start:393 stop:728 length:336 start_codon:yes stop_codon:yes gene_type:complete